MASSMCQKQKWLPRDSEHGLITSGVFFYVGVKDNRLNLFQFINDAKGCWPEQGGIYDEKTWEDKMHQTEAYTTQCIYTPFSSDEEISEDLDKHHKKVWIVIPILSAT